MRHGQRRAQRASAPSPSPTTWPGGRRRPSGRTSAAAGSSAARRGDARTTSPASATSCAGTCMTRSSTTPPRMASSSPAEPPGAFAMPARARSSCSWPRATARRSATCSGWSTSTSSAAAAAGPSGSCSTGSARCRRRAATATSSTGPSRRCATTSRRPATSRSSTSRSPTRTTTPWPHRRDRVRPGAHANARSTGSSTTASRAPRSRSSPVATGRTRSSPRTRPWRHRLVSSWTVELAYEALGRYRIVCERAGASGLAERLAGLCERLRADFNQHLVPDGVVTGLAHFGPDGVEYLLHPRDRLTGVSYRLLPMTRGIISGLFTPEPGATARRAHRAPPPVPGRRPAAGPADGLPRRHVAHLHPRGDRGQLRP